MFFIQVDIHKNYLKYLQAQGFRMNTITSESNINCASEHQQVDLAVVMVRRADCTDVASQEVHGRTDCLVSIYSRVHFYLAPSCVRFTVKRRFKARLVIVHLRRMESMTYRNVALPEHLVSHSNDATGPCTHHIVPPGAEGASTVLSVSRSIVDATYQCMGRGVFSQPSMPLLLQKWLPMHAGHARLCLMVINRRWLHQFRSSPALICRAFGRHKSRPTVQSRKLLRWRLYFHIESVSSGERISSIRGSQGPAPLSVRRTRRPSKNA